MTPIKSYILNGSLPEESDEAQKSRTLVDRYVIHNGTCIEK